MQLSIGIVHQFGTDFDEVKVNYKTFRIFVSYSILFSTLFYLHIDFLRELLKKITVTLLEVHKILQQVQNQNFIHPCNIPPLHLRIRKINPTVDNSST